MRRSARWRELPEIRPATPVLALAAAQGRLWAGGVGGVAYHEHGSWEPRLAGLHLGAVAALACSGGLLLAAGTGGIARSSDGGRGWQLAAVPDGSAGVAALALGPDFERTGIVLAATVGGGVLRSVDSGRSWESASFGIVEPEVTALAWGSGDNVLAGSADGIYRSPNAGRAWRIAAGSEGLAVAALCWLPGGSALAALEQGGLLYSPDGTRWQAYGALPAGLVATTLLNTGEELLLGSADAGLLRSTDAGRSWLPVVEEQILALAADAGTTYAGTAQGVLMSVDGGQSWRSLDPAPVHDLCRLQISGTALLVWGTHNGVMRYNTATGWQPLSAMPSPLAALRMAPDEALFAADPTGLFRSPDGGQHWTQVASAELGNQVQLSLGAAGQYWAGSNTGTTLLHSSDGGTSWKTINAPFGVHTLLALQALPAKLLAVSYDPRRRLAQPWRTTDGGLTWERGVAAPTAWPLAASFDRPPMLSLGDTLHYERSDGAWEAVQVGAPGGAVRRIVGEGSTLLALSTSGVYCSLDAAASWTAWEQELPAEQLMDLALDGGSVYALLAGGRVWVGAAREL